MPSHPPASCDLVIRNAVVYDGGGDPPYHASVAVTGARIAAMGALPEIEARRELDARGHALAPGFIDVHTHDDQALLGDPAMTPKATQGVTTVVTGNCGVSAAPLELDGRPPPPLDLLGSGEAYRFPRFADYLAALEDRPAAVNAVPMVGHSTLRVGAMNDVTRAADPAEIAAMRGRLEEALEAGAAGFSTGLFYPTNRAAPMEEVIALLEPLAGTGAVYATHMRDEAERVEDSLEESFETARRAGVPLVISHHKCMGEKNFGRSPATLGRIDRARVRQDVGLDVYPYTAGSTSLLADLLDQATRVIVTWSEPHPELNGRDLGEIAADWGCSPGDAVARLQPAGAIYFMIDEADMRRILAYRHSMIGSDGLPHDAHPHPRLWGTFPRVLGRYARDLGLLSLAEALRRMTGLPAETFKIAERGRIRTGYYADLVLFDPETILDEATFEDPRRPSRGIDWVMVNGAMIRESGTDTGARPGRLLRRRDAPTV